MTDCAQQLCPLGFAQPADSFAARWRKREENTPFETPAFASHKYIVDAAASIEVTEENQAALFKTLDAVLREPGLVRLWWHCSQELSELPWQYPQWLDGWPEIPEALGPDLRLFYVLVMLSCVDSIRRFHAERKVDAAISLDTLRDLNLWLGEQLRGDIWRDFFRPQSWLMNHFGGRLYKLGRLQFETHGFGNPIIAYRHLKDRRVVLLAGGGLKFRGDGQFDGADGVHDPNAFVSELTEDERCIRGHPILPRGAVQRQTLELEKGAWQKIFGSGDPCVGIHIAATGPMDHAQCGESMALAREFFPRCFPERTFKAFVCSSWLLDSQFEDWLPRESNIVRFLSEFYLYPLPHANDHQTMERVFGGPLKDLDAAPQKSTLQRAIVAHMKAGGHWRSQGAILFPEDLAWGKQVYRSGVRNG